MQALENRLNGASVECVNAATGWAVGASKEIVFLDRQDVKCGDGKFLARFHLVRQHGGRDSLVRFDYRCCKLVL